jgi:hypothetical protein
VAAVIMERWLPALGVVVGLSLMAAAAVAQDQPDAAPGAPPTAGSGAGSEAGSDRGFAGRPGPHGGWDRHGRDDRGGVRPMDRQQVCKEGYAHEAGFLAYLGAKLELTAPQQPLWNTYHQAMLDSSAKLRQVCLDNASTSQESRTALERRDRMEKFLTARLDFLHATRPPLDALYQSLSPEQRALLDRPHHRGPRHGR